MCISPPLPRPPPQSLFATLTHSLRSFLTLLHCVYTLTFVRAYTRVVRHSYALRTRIHPPHYVCWALGLRPHLSHTHIHLFSTHIHPEALTFYHFSLSHVTKVPLHMHNAYTMCTFCYFSHQFSRITYCL